MSDRRFFLTVLVAVTFAVGCIIGSMSPALAQIPPKAGEDRDVEWEPVRDAINQGLPKTAIERLEPIIKRTKTNQNYDAAVRAVCWKISLAGEIQGNLAEEKIGRLKTEIEQSPAEMRPVMQAVLANWYWQYFQQNRWQFMQRTQTAASPGDDFTTWDLARILDTIDEQFQEALSSEDQLKATSVRQYDEFLEQVDTANRYRPTLFDVLAHNAIDFYSLGEQAATKDRGSFELSADDPIFDDVEKFVSWEPAAEDVQSPILRGIELFQTLLRFHKDDTDPSAFLDNRLLSLKFGNAHAFGPRKTERYREALRQFADQNEEHPVSSRALHELGESLKEDDELDAAHAVATRGLELHPESVGGRRCFNLIQEIEAPSASVITERVWNGLGREDVEGPRISVTYRNVDKVYFRLVNFDFDDFINSDRWSAEQLDSARKQALLTADPVAMWDADLPATEDFQERVVSIEAADDVPPGSYFLIASHNPNFSRTKNQISFCEVWVSDLAIVVRNHGGDGLIDGFVLDARSGQPIVGAKVQNWYGDQRQQQRTELPPVRTDGNGMFRIKGSRQRQLVLLASHGDQSLSTNEPLNLYQATRSDRTLHQTVFFTDRSIYRPGQTIQFKGVCLQYDQTENSYQTLSRQAVTVVFSDVNGKEIEQLRLRTNDYGSFSGSVTAPRDRLMGRMQLAVRGQPRGQTAVTVEEYKRPKFRVDLKTPEAEIKLQEEVTVSGQADAYTGAAVNDAVVSWRVVRQIRYPIWWLRSCWWMPPPQSQSQEIAHGMTTTDDIGRFKISFAAKPDLSVPVESEPTFVYQVSADVTDGAGETRSNDVSIRVGYTSLAASMTAEDWLTDQQPTKINVRTESLGGDDRAAKGKVKIYRVQQPETVARAKLVELYGRRRREPEAVDPAQPASWPVGDVVFEMDFQTDASGKTVLAADLAAGMYRAKLQTRDRFGNDVNAELSIQVLDPDAKQFDTKIPFVLESQAQSMEPGNEFLAVWGSGYDSARAFIEIESSDNSKQSYWTPAGVTQTQIVQTVDESMRGGFTVRVTMVRENRAYIETRVIDVPWTNKQLEVTWEHFVSKLEPAAKETWTAVVRGPDAEAAAAEMVATLYDASLDAFLPHDWMDRFSVFRREQSRLSSSFQNQAKYLQNILRDWNISQRDAGLNYPRLPDELLQHRYGFDGGRMMMRGEAMMKGDFAMADAAPMAEGFAMESEAPASMAFAQATGNGEPAKPKPDFNEVPVRTNLNETAFFFPHLIAGKDGSVRMNFTMPEALTEWKFIGFAHDRELRSGSLTDTVVTAKDLMVQPNPPRFVREGDEIEFTVKVSNQSPTRQAGSARLSFSDAQTGKSVDAKLSNSKTDKTFEIPAGQSQSLAWRIVVPDGLGMLTYKAVGSTGRLSDGEAGLLPVLARRVLVTESISLPIRGKQTKEFQFTKLLKSDESQTLEHQSVTAQMVSNPSWYAVMALPYLMEFPHQCSEQTFNRLYANAMARHIANSDPKIEQVFAQWRATPALDSPLAKNEDLKSLVLEETPWLRQAESESQSRRNVGILFDQNRLDTETARAINQLTEMQLPDGTWPWFPGGRSNDFITLYITTGFGRMRHLGVEVDASAAVRSLNRLDTWMSKQYQDVKPVDRSENHLTRTVALYLYGRSFFLQDQGIAPEHLAAYDFWVSQAKSYWLPLGNRQSQAHIAVALKRLGEQSVASDIMASLKERSVSDEEMGMYWRDTERAWWWYAAPIETQAMMIEAFDEVMDDAQAVEDCKVWLLKQKQTQDWGTTKATADAVYAILLRGTNVLASNDQVKLSMGDQTLKPSHVEAGTGFFEQRFVGTEVKPGLGDITVTKVDDGVAWGSVHWQYFEDMSKVTPYEGTPLKIAKELYVKKNTDEGPKLVAVDGPVDVGDELVVRIVLRSDRDMEYLHLKDYRGSGTEPVNVLSGYKFQDGLAYYESTRDTASHFFIDYLPKGTYVFEYSTRVQLRGEYQTGYAGIQCMYAPEFGGHSESLPIVVR